MKAADVKAQINERIINALSEGRTPGSSRGPRTAREIFSAAGHTPG